MKTIRLLSVLLIVLSFVGCKEKEAKNEEMTDALVEEAVVYVAPRASDAHFEQAINAYEKGNKPEAAKQINAGIDALENEVKDLTGYNRGNLDLAKDQLRNMAGKLDDNFDISIEGLLEAIANAEINVAHDYLAINDVYVLMPKGKVNENKLHRALNHNLKSLEESTSKLEGAAKIEAQNLEAEGKKINEDYEAWQKRVEDHAKRSEALFKNHAPEYMYIW